MLDEAETMYILQLRTSSIYKCELSEVRSIPSPKKNKTLTKRSSPNHISLILDIEERRVNVTYTEVVTQKALTLRLVHTHASAGHLQSLKGFKVSIRTTETRGKNSEGIKCGRLQKNEKNA